MSNARIRVTPQAQKEAQVHYAAALRLIQKHKVSPRSMHIFNFRLQVAMQCEKAFSLNPVHPSAMKVWRNMVRASQGEILSLGKRILWNKLIAQSDAKILYQSKHGMITYKTFTKFQQEQNNQSYWHAMSTLQAQTTAEMQATLAKAHDAVAFFHARNKALSASLDKMAHINKLPQVQPTKSVTIQSPLYSLKDRPRSGGLPIQKTTSIFLASNTHPESFTGFNGAQCSYNDILYASQLVNNASEGAGNWGAAVSNQIDKYAHQDSKWECAPENIQPSTSSTPR